MTNDDFGRMVWRMGEQGKGTQYIRDAILFALRKGLPPCEAEIAFIECSESAGVFNRSGMRFAAEARKLIEMNKAQPMLQTGKEGDK